MQPVTTLISPPQNTSYVDSTHRCPHLTRQGETSKAQSNQGGKKACWTPSSSFPLFSSKCCVCWGLEILGLQGNPGTLGEFSAPDFQEGQRAMTLSVTNFVGLKPRQIWGQQGVSSWIGGLMTSAGVTSVVGTGSSSLRLFLAFPG